MRINSTFMFLCLLQILGHYDFRDHGIMDGIAELATYKMPGSDSKIFLYVGVIKMFVFVKLFTVSD